MQTSSKQKQLWDDILCNGHGTPGGNLTSGSKVPYTNFGIESYNNYYVSMKPVTNYKISFSSKYANAKAKRSLN